MNIIRDRTGFTLAEIIISMLILAIVTLAGLSSDIVLRYNLAKNIHRRYAALSVACSQIEDLKAVSEKEFNNDPGPLAEQRDTLSGDLIDKPSTLGNIPDDFKTPLGNITYTVENGDWNEDGTTDTDYKKIVVTCEYNNLANKAQMAAFIAEGE